MRFSRFIRSFSIVFILFLVLGFLGCKENEAEEVQDKGPLFSLVSYEHSGVNFVNKLPQESPAFNIVLYQYLHNGAGLSVGDVNNDGLPDIFFVANFGPDKLYLNKGNLQFEEIAQQAGVQGVWGWSTGSTMVDINSDGYLDIYVSRSGDMEAAKRKNALFINNGDLTFTERAAEYGLDDPGYSTQAAFLDYDRDGDLDMYLLNHPIKPVLGRDFDKARATRDPYTGDKLFRNDNGKFTDVSEAAGIHGSGIGYGLSVSVGDLDNDGWPDMYVCNDYSEHDFMYFNNQDGTFSEKTKSSTRHISNFSMGSDIADFNNDGLLDIMVVDMVAEDNYRIKTNMSGMSPEAFYGAVENGLHHQYMMNTLQMNNGNGTFSEVSQLAGLSSTDWSWAPLWADFDRDGLKDLLVTNGLRKEARNNDFVNRKKEILLESRDYPNQRMEFIKMVLDEMPEQQIKNYIFKNEGDISFSNKQEEWGLTEVSFSNGAAYSDLDNDGDLDIVISNLDHPAFIYKNNAQLNKDSKFLKIKLEGSPQNKSGLGTRVSLTSNGAFQMQEHYLNRGYQSSVEDQLFFGLGSTEKVDSLWVAWPDGNQQLITNVAANQTLTLSYAESEPGLNTQMTADTSDPIFSEVTDELGVTYSHKENDYDDFERESLLPHRLSMQGPGMAVGDVNGDGADDFYVGGASGFSGALYLQNDDGTFSEKPQTAIRRDRQSEDVAAVFFDAENDGDLDLYVVSGGNEFEPGSEALQDRLYLNNGQGSFTKSQNALPEMNVSGGVVSPTDYDNDGDIDLFIGGRLVPGSYPVAPRSYLLENTNGAFEDVTLSMAPELENPGLVTSGLWMDFDGDGNEDLILAGEWMPITVFRNNGGSFTNVTSALGLNDTPGWWNSLAKGDFDGDGDDDLVAGNLGLNYKYDARPDAPFNVYYDDFDGNQTGDIVLTYNQNGEEFPLRGRECSSEQMPFIKEKFVTYDAFAKANLEDVFGAEKLEKALHLEALMFAIVFVENRGDENWTVSPLPRLAQLSSLNGLIPKDVTGDNILDLVIAGNLYEAEVETPRNDAGNGLVLKGDGKGNFKPLTCSESGVFAPGNVKEVHILTIDQTPHLTVVNNSDRIQFFSLNL